MHSDELSSIFPFLIRDAEGHYLEQTQVKVLYEQLNRDQGETPGLTAEERTLAAQCYHIGQPVKIDGQHDANHLEEELRQVRIVLEKLALCVQQEVVV